MKSICSFSGAMWVIGKNYTKREFIAYWPQKIPKLRTPKQNIFSLFLPSPPQSKKSKRRSYKEFLCPIESNHTVGYESLRPKAKSAT